MKNTNGRQCLNVIVLLIYQIVNYYTKSEGRIAIQAFWEMPVEPQHIFIEYWDELIDE